ncbi:hypothetical protein GN956_G21297 [Arapaima gigas]
MSDTNKLVLYKITWRLRVLLSTWRPEVQVPPPLWYCGAAGTVHRSTLRAALEKSIEQELRWETSDTKQEPAASPSSEMHVQPNGRQTGGSRNRAGRPGLVASVMFPAEGGLNNEEDNRLRAKTSRSER